MNPVPQAAKMAKEERFNIRATREEKETVEEAARLSHVTASQFILQAAVRSAHDVLADQTRFTLTPEQWAQLTAMLDRPARSLPALKKAAAEPRPFRDR